jgi:hypothetical protein
VFLFVFYVKAVKKPDEAPGVASSQKPPRAPAGGAGIPIPVAMQKTLEFAL